jgi:hypothetical protein
MHFRHYLIALKQVVSPAEFEEAKELPQSYGEALYGKRLAYSSQVKECEALIAKAKELVYSKDEKFLNLILKYASTEFTGRSDPKNETVKKGYWAGPGHWYAACELSPLDEGSSRLGGYIPKVMDGLEQELIMALITHCDLTVLNAEDGWRWINTTIEGLAFRDQVRDEEEVAEEQRKLDAADPEEESYISYLQQSDYDVLTGLWRNEIGRIHADDAETVENWEQLVYDTFPDYLRKGDQFNVK